MIDYELAKAKAKHIAEAHDKLEAVMRGREPEAADDRESEPVEAVEVETNRRPDLWMVYEPGPPAAKQWYKGGVFQTCADIFTTLERAKYEAAQIPGAVIFHLPGERTE